MTTKPSTADGYDLATTQHAKATCLYVATKLGDLMDSLVAIGGLVLPCLFPKLNAASSPRRMWAPWTLTWGSTSSF